MVNFESGFFRKAIEDLDLLSDAELANLIEAIRHKQGQREDDRIVDFALKMRGV